ncbi:MAG: M28 family peptidase [Anaerolineae bacterium]|nr:M28 family peptidase [Anaerolineae bacterium]
MDDDRNSFRNGVILLVAALLIGLGGYGWFLQRAQVEDWGDVFLGQRALEDVAYQIELGPRVPGSQAHAKTVNWIVKRLENAGWDTEVQKGSMLGHEIKNIVAKKGKGAPWVILGAHYDSRIVADQDQDPAMRGLAVPGANDGASGVAVLLELARVLPEDLDKEVWLVFFDAEDNGNIAGWEWIMGSRVFVGSLDGKPDVAVILDMIGDRDLNIFYERNSDKEFSEAIWRQAALLGNERYFIPSYKFAMLDDHTPFLEAGIRAVDIIDFDYPFWHTVEDTVDKVSAESLEIVGETILAWLLADWEHLDG